MLNFPCGDDVIRWDSYNNEFVCNRFSIDEWHKMVCDIDTEIEWQTFLSDYSDFVKCYMLKKNNTNEAIGFVYLYRELPSSKVVSVHGGIWDSKTSSFLAYRAIFLLIEHLLSKGIKVRTSCLIENKRAYHFLKGVGFVKYYSSQTHTYMWINQKRLNRNPIYKRLKEGLLCNI